MAHELRHALTIAHKMTVIHDGSHTRLWYPRLTWAWLGLAPSMLINDEGPIPEESQHQQQDSESALSLAEARQGVAEKIYPDPDPDPDPHRIPIAKTLYKSRPRFQILRISSWIYGLWTTRTALHMRLALSRFLRAMQHSHHIKYGTKNALGVMLLSFPAFFPAGSGRKRAYDSLTLESS